MQIQTSIDITHHTTLKLPASASYFCVVKNLIDVEQAISFAGENNLDIFILGGGSNIVVENLKKKIVIKNEIKGIENLNNKKFLVGAGEVWDDFVKYTVDQEICCLASLSFIPGTVGGAPIQNIGAYGTEVGNYIEQVEVFDMHTDTITMLSKKDCNFSYRDSVFKQYPHRYVVLRVLFHLNNCSCDVPNYPGVQDYMVGAPNAQTIRSAVIATRQSKLPDWHKDYNVGSFFKNPEVTKEFTEKLQTTFPNLVWFDVGVDRAKISAGWLIEHAGLKGFEKGNFKTYEKHALVIIHSGSGTYDELKEFISLIRSRVEERFGVLLEQEPITI